MVDVGGGMGSPTVELAQAFPRLMFIVQDQESVAQKALEVRLLYPSRKNLTKWDN